MAIDDLNALLDYQDQRNFFTEEQKAMSIEEWHARNAIVDFAINAPDDLQGEPR